ncbi:hypothetical protein [Planococcus salinarum]|uniref:hypothetical protein n=1 Tax=Planococcus salinarum TaxID=622695 RepID=UPI000E3C3192|nr:hypothetical protein [Planococcus salinarum]TAA72147.1 hypothetical protein D2909_08110 [Planococcus salinarum]
MDSRKTAIFIKKANRRLKLQYMAKTLQTALGLGLAAALLVTVISRLSIIPYYGFYAYTAAALMIAAILLMGIRKLPRREQAIRELDHFTPHNRLLTLSQIPGGSPLADDLATQTEKEIHLSYQLFQKENNDWLSAKWLLLSLGISIVLLISGIVPASTQLAAKDQELEQELIEEIIETVKKQQEQTESPLVQKELENLREKLSGSETPEQVLRELVKKQKELALKQQQKEQEGTQQASEEAKQLEEASDQLAEQAGDSQTALSEMGKPVAFDLRQSIAANDNSGDPQESGGGEPESAGDEAGSEGSGQQGNESRSGNDATAVEDGSAGEASEGTSGENGTDGTSDGQGQGEGEGADSSSGGEATGTGSGQETATGPGNGAGSGQGTRELLSIPDRIGGNGDTAVDGGELSEGETGSFEEGAVDAERGSVRPYQEVVGFYSESYFSSAERMKLPPDLQKIVEQYFSAIESD